MSRVVAPTQLNQVVMCALSIDFIHSTEEASLGTNLRTWESREIAAPVSILCACLDREAHLGHGFDEVQKERVILEVPM